MTDVAPGSHGADPSLIAVLHASAAENGRKLNALRLQMLFMFMFLVAALVVMTVFFRDQDDQIKHERYTWCTTRASELAVWNATLPADVPHYIPSPCPPDPYTD